MLTTVVLVCLTSNGAAQRNQLSEAYNLVTTRCVECHKYVRDVRMARLDPKPLRAEPKAASASLALGR